MMTDNNLNPEITTFLQQAQKLIQSGQGREAYGQAMQWLSKYPNDLLLLLFMARTAMSLGQYKVATAHFSQMYEQKPHHVAQSTFSQHPRPRSTKETLQA